MYDENVTCRYLIVQGINLLRLRKCRVGMSNHIRLFYVGMIIYPATVALQWRNHERDGVPNHQPHNCLFNSLFRRRSKKASKLRITWPCVRGIHRWPDSLHKGPVMRKIFPFDDVVMINGLLWHCVCSRYMHIFIMCVIHIYERWVLFCIYLFF